MRTGRATVELIIERTGSGEAFVTRSGGGPVPQARIAITLDGYSAPLTAGNFAANIQDGVYNGKTVNASYASVLAGRGLIPGAAPCTTEWLQDEGLYTRFPVHASTASYVSVLAA